MFQTQASLRKKAQGGNIDREEFISLLASEFYSTTNEGENFVLLVEKSINDWLCV